MRASLLILWSVLSCGPLFATAQTQAKVAYTPDLTRCPSGVSLVRETNATNQSLSKGESTYVTAKQEHVLPAAWKSYLATVNASTANASALPSYVSKILNGSYGSTAYPKFSIATSGGGYRAATFGAGVLNALDGRNSSSVHAGTGGLLQAATYLAGLSGGSWLITSLAQADFPTVADLVFGTSHANASTFGGWIAQKSLLDPSNSTLVDVEYVHDLVEEVQGKEDKGYPVTFTDIWARALSRHFVNGTDAADFFGNNLTHGAGLTFSSLSRLQTFANYVQPFPIVVSDSMSAHGNQSNVLNVTDDIVPLTNPIYEFNVFEMGSFDPMLSAFTPTEYLGSPNSSICATGFDQLSFIEGLSSSLFNEAEALGDATIAAFIETLSNFMPNSGTQYFMGRIPNPFHGVSPHTFIDTNETVLQLVDGGEDGETVPFMPLLVKTRGVEVIFAIDVAADTNESWSQGSSIIATQDRMKYFAGTYAFPPVPSQQSTFVEYNLTKRPTFFGCNSTAASDEPLVIYLANGGAPLGQTGVTNTSTYQLAYSADELEAMLSQTFDVATQGIAVRGQSGWEKDPEWPGCLACAVVDRSRRREGIELSGLCASCLKRYCWS